MRRRLLTVLFAGVALVLVAMLVMTTMAERAKAEARRQECNQVLAEAHTFALETSTLGVVPDADGGIKPGLVERPLTSSERTEADALGARARAACLPERSRS
jgi:Na+-translocating ferredoxin:NAD+ oxidoreductase RnfG subunit